MAEKLYGWIVVKILDVSAKNITFVITESELRNGLPKFPNLLNRTITYVRKKKIWNSTISRSDEYSVHFVDTGKEFMPQNVCEYLLLISTFTQLSVEIWKAGTMEDFCRIFGRLYVKANDSVYEVTIPVLQGFVKGTLLEIIAKLKKNCPGDPKEYLTHQDTSWSILAPDGEFKETTMPVLPG